MFNDQLALMHDTAGAIKLVSAVDWSQPRKSVRRSSDRITTLTIGDQSTSENKGYDTTRYSIRLDEVYDPGEGAPKCKTVVQLMISLPDQNDALTALPTLVAQLLNVLVVGETLTDGTGKIDPSHISAMLTRLIAGEH
jgi:hypothetical protein